MPNRRPGKSCIRIHLSCVKIWRLEQLLAIEEMRWKTGLKNDLTRDSSGPEVHAMSLYERTPSIKIHGNWSRNGLENQDNYQGE